MTNRKTVVTIEGDAFHINGAPTYAGRTYGGRKIEGLLLNARMVQGVFDDLNPETRALWDYPDGPWDPDRNTDEFVAAMPAWRCRRASGLHDQPAGRQPPGLQSGPALAQLRLHGARARCATTTWRGSRASWTGLTIWVWSRSWATSTSARTSGWPTSMP